MGIRDSRSLTSFFHANARNIIARSMLAVPSKNIRYRCLQMWSYLYLLHLDM